MATTITANQFLSNFLDLYPNENWDELPSLTEDIRFARRLLYVDRLLGENFNGDIISRWKAALASSPFTSSFHTSFARLKAAHAFGQPA